MTQMVPAHPDAEQMAPPATPPATKKGGLGQLRLLIPLGLIVVAAGFGAQYWWQNRPDETAIQLSGRIESYQSDLGAKVGGRIESIAVREGDRVKAGQVIAKLDDPELSAQLAAAKARVNAAQQGVTQAELQVEVVNSQVQEAQLTLAQAQGDTTGQVSQSEAAVATANAQLLSAQAQARQAASALELARVDRDRFSTLVAQGAVSQQQFDQAQTQFEAAQDTLAAQQAAAAAAEQQINAAEGALTQSQTSQLNPEIRTAQVNRTQKQQAQAESQIVAANAELAQAKAAQSEIEAQLNNLEIKSPIDGIVLTRMVEPGEVISAGAPVITVVNLENIYLRGYIPEGQVGEVRVGQAAQVFLDSAPAQPLAATVSAIDTEASFTPENIYFKDDRVTQVFGLKLDIDNPGGFAKPGMPADGEILLDAARPLE
jgi:HlyD family secretion protein